MARPSDDLPRRHPDACIVDEALRTTLFAAQWHNPIDRVLFRPFAVAMLRLARVNRAGPAERQAWFLRLATERRARLLAAAAGQAIGPGLLRLLARTDWRRFTRADWQLLIRLAADPAVGRLLCHAQRIAPRLVRQLAFVPGLLRTPPLLEVLNGLTVSRAAWERLSEALGRAEAPEPVAARRKAFTIRDIGSFWDFYFWCIEGRHRPFPLPEAAFESPLIEPLTSARAMRTEALRMRNCLGKLTGRAATGRAIYFRGRGRIHVTASLSIGPTGWRPGLVLGFDNKPIERELAEAVRRDLLTMAAKMAAPESFDRIRREDAFPLELGSGARRRFSTRQIESLACSLMRIRGRSRAWNDGAFVIFETRSHGYVQFMSSVEGDEYLCEVASHRFQPALQRFLTGPAVELLQKAGFLWPNSEENFIRWFAVGDCADFRILAELALVILAEVYRHSCGRDLEVKLHIPQN